MPPRPWDRKDESILRRLFSSNPTSKIAILLNRTEAAVDNHAKLLGLKKQGSEVERKERMLAAFKLKVDAYISKDGWPRVETTIAGALHGRRFEDVNLKSSGRLPQRIMQTTPMGAISNGASSLCHSYSIPQRR